MSKVAKYAEGTEVPVGRSRDEIERTLARFGSTAQAWMRDDEKGVVTVAFKRGGHAYRFTVPSPPLSEFMETPSGRWARTEAQALMARDTEIRRRFRSLANYVKAVLDATESGIIKADEALLPYLLLPEGDTVYQRASRQLERGVDVSLARALMAPDALGTRS
ncbi:MAG: hypothetical protein Q8O40_11760 [Chloroflexota bacterium]|nr:hypothetical protein [Chloroflexota bacterium]